MENEIPIINEQEEGYYEVFEDHLGNIIKKIWHEKKRNFISTNDIINEQLNNVDNVNEKLDIISNKMKFKSKQQLDEETKFSLLPQDDYELIITETKPATRNKYQAKPNPDGSIPQEEIVNITLEVVGFKDGKPAKDVDGGEAGGRKVFFTFRPQAMGYSEGGTIPSKSRSFLAYATGQGVNDELELGSYEELVGKTVFAEIVQYINQKGKTRNKISRVLPPPRR